MADISPLLIRLARQRNLDPRALRAVAMGEGGLVNREEDIGDLAGGGSYGPFQLYAKGALPRRFVGNPRAADAWAWSPEGISYALDQMVKVGAAGLRGPAAIERIIRQFEKPKYPDKSVAAALARLGSMPKNTLANTRAMPVPAPQSFSGAPLGSSLQSTQNNTTANALLAGLAGGQKVSSILRGLPALLASQSGGGGAVSDAHNTTPHVRSVRPAPPKPFMAPRPGSVSQGYGIRELFHDPLGGIDEGHEIGAIGGHGKHVHYAAKTAQDMLRAIALARKLGLATRENPYVDPVDPVHTKGSFHYQLFPGLYNGKKLGQGIDVSGNPQAMKTFYQRLAGLR